MKSGKTLHERWNRIRIANLYDALDAMGYPNQCLDLAIGPIIPHQHLAGIAVTARGARDPRRFDDLELVDGKLNESKGFFRIVSQLFPGAVLVIDGGGEKVPGKWGR